MRPKNHKSLYWHLYPPGKKQVVMRTLAYLKGRGIKVQN